MLELPENIQTRDLLPMIVTLASSFEFVVCESSFAARELTDFCKSVFKNIILNQS